MPDLYIFSANYPFGDRDTFPGNEIFYLSKFFHRIFVIPATYPMGVKERSRTPANVKVLPPFLSENIPVRIFRALFNFSPGGIFIYYFFFNYIFTSKVKFLRWANDFTCTRTFLSSKQYQFIKRRIKEYDILYFFWGVDTASVIPYIRLKNRIVVRLHGGDAYLPVTDGFLPLRRGIYKRVDRILTVSDALRKYIIDNYRSEDIIDKTVTSRLGTCYYNTNPAEFYEEIVLVSCSSLIPLKRIDLIIKCLKQIDRVKVSWHHFGDGYLMPELKDQCHGLPENISANFHGYIKNEEVMRFYAENHVDLFINVSSTEGIPVSIMEAMSFGIAVAATNVGSTNEIVDNECGFLLSKDFQIHELIHIILTVRKMDFELKRTLSKKKWNDLFNAENNAKFLLPFLIA